MFEVLIIAASVWALVAAVRNLDAKPQSKSLDHRSCAAQPHSATFENNIRNIGRAAVDDCLEGQEVELVPESQYSENPEAVKVLTKDGEKLGYVRAGQEIVEQMRSGRRFRAWIDEVAKSSDGSDRHRVAIWLEPV
jgi:hypothetical protein